MMNRRPIQVNRLTRLDDLPSHGHELREAHLALATGGRMSRTTYQTYIQCQHDTGHDD